MSAEACASATQNALGRTARPHAWLRTLAAQRRAQRDLARQTRDGITLRIGKPPRGPRPPIPVGIELATAAAHGALFAAATILTIGG